MYLISHHKRQLENNVLGLLARLFFTTISHVRIYVMTKIQIQWLMNIEVIILSAR